MTAVRAIAATFSDWRTVKSRKALQLIFEVSLEQQADVLTMLGAPLPDEPKWCGIALLNPPAGTPINPSDRKDQPTPAPSVGQAGHHPDEAPPAGGTRSRSEIGKEHYRNAPEMEKALIRAARLSDDERFRAWLTTRYWPQENEAVDEAGAVFSIRNICCDGGSRKLIAEDPACYQRYIELETEFRISVGEMATPR